MNIAAAQASPPSRTYPGPGGRRIDWTLVDVVWGIGWFIALFVVIPLPFVIAAALASGDGESTTTYAVGLLAGYGSEAGLVAVAAWFSFRKYGGSWERLGFAMPTWSAVGWGAAALVTAFALSVAYGLLIDKLDVNALKSKCDDQVPDKIVNSVGLMTLAGIAAIAFAPVCEETFFRGFIFPGLTRNWGVAAGIVGSALLFSAAHVGPNIHKTLIPIFIIGAVFAFSYYRSGNILSTMGAHLVFNSISFGVLAGAGCHDDLSLVHSASWSISFLIHP